MASAMAGVSICVKVAYYLGYVRVVSVTKSNLPLVSLYTTKRV